ncbi:hypothetical protein JXA02_01155 [candidate division KSB1 bacterium]|nr:hypothetical protein [candidate division KSB1 bacterium]RQW11059.1 MAG: hypothetical protein EH222_01230 [candidate division KSB1 bacterium]
MRYFLIIVASVLILRLDSSAQDCLYRQALELLKQENYSDAVSDFAAIVNGESACPDVDMADVHFWRGWAYYRIGDQEQALNDFRLAESSTDNGDNALYMRLRLERLKNPTEIPSLERNVSELNDLLNRPDISPSLKDRASLYRNLLRLQLGEMLYHRNAIVPSKAYFQGIWDEEPRISALAMNDINMLIRARALLWILHERHILGEKIDDQLVAQLLQAQLPGNADGAAGLADLVLYHRSMLDLLSYLLTYDYQHFVSAKDNLQSLSRDIKPVENYQATLDLLDGKYDDVIGSFIGDDAFGDFRIGWAHFLRHKGEKDLSQAQQRFRESSAALPACQSALRKASAFRYKQTRHFLDWCGGEFAEAQLSSYFSGECINESDYLAQKQTWIDIFEECQGYISPNCQTGRGYLDIGLYRGIPKLVENGKKQLLRSSCIDLDDDLTRAILFCIGDQPDFVQAINLLATLLEKNDDDQDEIKYALAMAYYNNGDASGAIPLLDDLAKRGSLDACYKLASIYRSMGDDDKACRYANALMQNQDMYTIYRADANALFGAIRCDARGTAAFPLPRKSLITFREPEYKVFAYDYIGDGFGVISKLYYQMKSDIVKFITPKMDIDFYDLELLEPVVGFTAYIHLTVKTPFDAEPNLRISVGDIDLPGASLQKVSDYYFYDSGPLDIGDFKIMVNQRGSFGWMYKNFISGNFQRTVTLDSAFVLQQETASIVLDNVSQVHLTADGVTAFSPESAVHLRRQHRLPQDIGVVSAVAAANDTFFCLIGDQSKVNKVTFIEPDKSSITPFIRGTYDPEKDVVEYSGGLRKPLDILFNAASNTIHILNSDGVIFEFNRQGRCIGAIGKPAASSFILDIEYDEDEHCLWLLDIQANMIHKYDLNTRAYDGFQASQRKFASDLHPISVMTDANYFYLATSAGDLHLHKKENFRRLAVFTPSDKDDFSSYNNFSLIGRSVDSRRIIALKKKMALDKIWPTYSVEMLTSKFDADFELEEMD